MSEIIKRKDEREKEKTKTKRKKVDPSYSENARAKWFCCAFKLLGFIQLMCQASLIFKLNWNLDWSIILKERELYKLKHALVECKCLKIRDLLSFLICSSTLDLKWQQVSLYTRKSVKSPRTGSLYENNFQVWLS